MEPRRRASRMRVRCRRLRRVSASVLRRSDGRTEAEAIHLLLQVVGREVRIHLGRKARILMAHDPLNRRQIGPTHEQKRSRRVPQMMKADLPNLPDGEELEVAPGAAAQIRIGMSLGVPAALASALVIVARHDAGRAHRPTKHVLQLGALREHLPVRTGEHQVGSGGLLSVLRFEPVFRLLGVVALVQMLSQSIGVGLAAADSCDSPCSDSQKKGSCSPLCEGCLCCPHKRLVVVQPPAGSLPVVMARRLATAVTEPSTVSEPAEIMHVPKRLASA
jgi:hypothetical protein